MKYLYLWSLSALLALTGCATTETGGPPTAAGDAPKISSVPHTPNYPSGPLSPINAASLQGNGAVTSLAVPDDLWDRIRRGFAMPDLENDLVGNQEQWYSSRPDYIQRMTQRSSKYMFHIVEELERRGMPTELALLPYIESAYNPQAVSSAKAAGMWQFMPATGTYFDLKQNMFRDDRRDVLASTRAALDYLQKLYNMFGDWHLALAAYNWGEGSVGRAIARNQKQGLGGGYTDLSMPDETRNYVPKLQAVKNIIAHPERFQAELPLIENHPYFQAVTLDRDIDTAQVAEMAGVTMDELKSLNPSFNRPVIFKAGTPQVLLPWDNANVFRRNLQAHEKGQYASWTVWTVPSTMTVATADGRHERERPARGQQYSAAHDGQGRLVADGAALGRCQAGCLQPPGRQRPHRADPGSGHPPHHRQSPQGRHRRARGPALPRHRRTGGRLERYRRQERLQGGPPGRSVHACARRRSTRPQRRPCSPWQPQQQRQKARRAPDGHQEGPVQAQHQHHEEKALRQPAPRQQKTLPGASFFMRTDFADKGLALCWAQHRGDGMREGLEKLLTKGQDSAVLRFGLGQACLKEEDYAAAALHLAQAVAQNPQYSAAWKLLGKAQLESGVPDARMQAQASWQQGLQVAEQQGDTQTVKELTVFLKRLQKAAE